MKKKIISTILLLITLCSFLFTGCGWSEETSEKISKKVQGKMAESHENEVNPTEEKKEAEPAFEPEGKKGESEISVQSEEGEKTDEEAADDKETAETVTSESRNETEENKPSENLISEKEEEAPEQKQPEVPVQSLEEKTEGKKEENKENICTISINCKNLYNKKSELSPEIAAILPENGIILGKTGVKIEDGDTVFEILKRVTKTNNIHLEFSVTPVYNSAYIEGLANIYEFDGGELSGWMYSVNGKYKRFGCSEASVKNGDVIEWVYTCDLGKDVGDSFSVGE